MGRKEREREREALTVKRVKAATCCQEVPPKLKAKGYDFELARKEDVAERAVAALKDPMS